MRRLIAAIYEFFFGIRITTAKQHIEDLTKMLNDLLSAHDVLQKEIYYTADQLVAARLRLAALKDKIK